MINIITGEVNQGKTSKLLNIYSKIKCGDGFFNRKVYINGHYAGQDIVRLSTSEAKALSFKEGYIPSDWDEAYRYSTYSFCKTGFLFAEDIVSDIIKNNINPIFIDEIGPLELQEKGFYNIFKLCLQIQGNLYVVIRRNLLNEIINKFEINKYMLIYLGENQKCNVH